MINIRKFAGVCLIGAAVGFGWGMNHTNWTTIDHTLEGHFQQGLTPSADYLNALDVVVDLMQANTDYQVLVVGYTGTRPMTGDSANVAEERANLARSELIDAGIDPERITAVAASPGDLLPREPHETDALWQKRLARVVFFVGADG